MTLRLGVVALVAALSLPAGGATVKRLDGGPPRAAAKSTEARVTIDVKDAEAVEILKSMQKQCGVRNLMIDPSVKGTGTFYFHEVPCRQAWGVVLRSLGLDAAIYPSSVITVGTNTKR